MGAAEQIDLDDAQKAQTEEDDDGARKDVHQCLIFQQKAAQRARQRAHRHEHHREAQNEAQNTQKRTLQTAVLAAAGKVGQINGQHGQQTGGDEGDDTLQKGNEILQRDHPFFRISYRISGFRRKFNQNLLYPAVLFAMIKQNGRICP